MDVPFANIPRGLFMEPEFSPVAFVENINVLNTAKDIQRCIPDNPDFIEHWETKIGAECSGRGDHTNASDIGRRPLNQWDTKRDNVYREIGPKSTLMGGSLTKVLHRHDDLYFDGAYRFFRGDFRKHQIGAQLPFGGLLGIAPQSSDIERQRESKDSKSGSPIGKDRLIIRFFLFMFAVYIGLVLSSKSGQIAEGKSKSLSIYLFGLALLIGLSGFFL